MATTYDSIDWLEPWSPIDDPKVGSRFEVELRREVARGHILFQRPAKAIAVRSDQDDVLYAVDNPPQFAIVHLTYTSPDYPPFPRTVVFDSLAEFAERRMKADHLDFS